MKLSLCRVLTAGCMLFLSACGGGGGGTPAATAPQAPAVPATTGTIEGVWTGNSSSGYKSTAVILENNEIWNIFGIETNGVLYLQGFDYGVGTLTGTSFSGSVREFYPNNTSATGTLSASLVPNVSLNGVVTSNLGAVTFASTPISSSLFNYNKAASTSDIAGNWTGTFLNGAPGSIAISSTGVVTGNSYTCTFSGTIAPRSSGKNIFNVSINFGGSPCLFPNQNTTGIGVVLMTTAGKQQLIVGALTGGKSSGSIFVANR